MGEDEQAIICQLSSNSMLRVRLKVNNRLLRAVVDTAAQVTLISDKVLKKLEPTPLVIREVTLQNAGRDLPMKGVVVGPVTIQLGQLCVNEDVHVAPIEDDMLLGLDFLRRHKVDIHIKDLELIMEGQATPLEFEIIPGESKVARVTLQYRVVTPPNTVKRITGVLDQRIPPGSGLPLGRGLLGPHAPWVSGPTGPPGFSSLQGAHPSAAGGLQGHTPGVNKGPSCSGGPAFYPPAAAPALPSGPESAAAKQNSASPPPTQGAGWRSTPANVAMVARALKQAQCHLGWKDSLMQAVLGVRAPVLGQALGVQPSSL